MKQYFFDEETVYILFVMLVFYLKKGSACLLNSYVLYKENIQKIMQQIILDLSSLDYFIIVFLLTKLNKTFT